MNSFVIAAGFLFMFGALNEMIKGHTAMGIVYFCYAVANFALATMK